MSGRAWGGRRDGDRLGFLAGAGPILALALVAQLAGGGLRIPFVVVARRPIRAVRAKMPGVAATLAAVLHDALLFNTGFTGTLQDLLSRQRRRVSGARRRVACRRPFRVPASRRLPGMLHTAGRREGNCLGSHHRVRPGESGDPPGTCQSCRRGPGWRGAFVPLGSRQSLGS